MNNRRPLYLDFSEGKIVEFGDSDKIHPNNSGGGGDFVDLGDVPTSYASQGGKYVRVNTANNVSNNSDKSTSIRAFRIA